MVIKSFESFTKALKNLKDIFPKKSISNQYLDMMSLAVDFAEAMVIDEINNAKRNGVKIDYKEISSLFYKMYNYHIDNQIKMFIASQK